MKYLLDTNICSYIIKHRPLAVHAKFKSLSMDDCTISSITVAELKYWVARNKKLHQASKNDGDPKINARIINDFIHHLQVMDFDSHAAEIYGDLRAELQAKGNPIGHMDLLIGAHALSLDATLVTNNLKEFKQISHLKLENWL